MGDTRTDGDKPLPVTQGLLPGQMSEGHLPSQSSACATSGDASKPSFNTQTTVTLPSAAFGTDNSVPSIWDSHRERRRSRFYSSEDEHPGCKGAKGSDLKKGVSLKSTRSKASRTSRVSSTAGSHSSLAIMHSLSPKTLDSITFQDGVLVRGIDLRRVMSRFAKIFSSPVGDDGDSQAEEVPYIRTFISHNWSLPRLQKFLMLIVTHNSRRATSAAVLASLVCCALVAVGQLPVYESVQFHSFHGGDIVERSMYSLVLSTFSFVLMLLFGHEVDRCSKHPVFLDKACISQEDPELKRKGIESIGAFLFHCEKMLVLYSDAYLQRLWTVFELGLFLTLRQGAPIVVVPVFMPTLVIGGFLLCSFKTIGFEVLQMRHVVEHYPDTNRSMRYLLFFAVLVLFGVLAGYVLRRWAREHHNIHRYAKEFSIRKAICANEQDRDLIQGNVIGYLRDLCIVESTHCDDEVLSTFDRLVAKTVPKVLETSIGHLGIPYCCVVMMQLSAAAGALEALSVDIRSEEPTRVCTLNLALELVLVAAVHPLLLAALAWILSAQLQLTGLRDMCYTYGSSLAVAMSMFVASQGLRVLCDEAKDDDRALALVIVASLALLSATFCVYGRRWLLFTAKRLCPHSDGFVSLSELGPQGS